MVAVARRSGMMEPPTSKPNISVLAGSRLLEAELCEVRDAAGELVRTCSIQRGRAIIDAGLGYAVGQAGQHVRLHETPRFARTNRMADCNVTIRVDAASRAIEHDGRCCAAYSKDSPVPHPAQRGYLSTAKTNRERLEREREREVHQDSSVATSRATAGRRSKWKISGKPSLAVPKE